MCTDFLSQNSLTNVDPLNVDLFMDFLGQIEDRTLEDRVKHHLCTKFLSVSKS